MELSWFIGDFLADCFEFMIGLLILMILVSILCQGLMSGKLSVDDDRVALTPQTHPFSFWLSLIGIMLLIPVMIFGLWLTFCQSFL